MTDANKFQKKLTEISFKFKTNTTELLKKAAKVINQTVILATPVDTGRARSNWLVSIDQPRKETIETLGKDPSAAISEGNQVINGYKKENKAIYISNNLPYIGRLNEGYSAQAPAAFVEQAVAAAVNAIEGVQIL
jgi:hypothetical protein